VCDDGATVQLYVVAHRNSDGSECEDWTRLKCDPTQS
jgi:hypothetical protein